MLYQMSLIFTKEQIAKITSYNHVFNLEEVAFIHGMKHAEIATSRRGQGQNPDEEILRCFLLKFPKHEWPRYASQVMAIELVMLTWEEAPEYVVPR